MKFYNELELGCNSVKVVDYNQDGFEEGGRKYYFPEESGTIATREFLGNSLADHENVEASENSLGHVKITGEVLENSTSAVTSGGVYEAIQTSLTSVMTYKGTLAKYNDLKNLTNKKTGDVWNITETGDNYAWDGSDWDKLAGTFDVSAAIEAHNNDANANSAAIEAHNNDANANSAAIAKHDAIEWGVHGKAFDFFKDVILGGGFETQKIGGGTVNQATSKFISNDNHIQLSNNDYISFVSGSCSDTSNYYLDSGCGGTGTSPAAIATRNYVDESKTNITTEYKSYVDGCVSSLSGCVSGLEGCVSGLEGCVGKLREDVKSDIEGCVSSICSFLVTTYWSNIDSWFKCAGNNGYLTCTIKPYVESNITDPIKECVCVLENSVDAIEKTTNKLEDIIYTPDSSELVDDGKSTDKGGFTGWVGNPSILGIPEGAYFDIDKITIRRDDRLDDINVLRYLKVLVSNDAGDAWETAFFSTNAIKYSGYDPNSDITWTLENKLGRPILSKSGNVGRIIILQTTKSYDDPDETPTTVTLSVWRARTTGTTNCGFAGGSIPTNPAAEISTAGFSPSISVSYNINKFESKQDKLTAGSNITIENNVISATATAAATWGSIIREPKASAGVLQEGGTRSIFDSNLQVAFEVNSSDSKLRRATNNGTAEVSAMCSSNNVPVAAVRVLDSSNTNTVGKVLVKNDDVEIAGASGSLKVSSSGITANGLGININNCSVIRENIDPGEFKVTHYGSNDGFVIKTETPDGGGDVKLIKMFSTNGNDGYFYAFPALSEKNCTETLALRSDVSGLATCVQGCICTMGTLFTAYVQQLAEGTSDLEASVQGCIATINSDISKRANSADVYTKTCTNTLLSAKQDKLTAGSNITIENNVISATGGGSGTTVDAYTKSEVDGFLASKLDTTCTAIGGDSYAADGCAIAIGWNAYAPNSNDIAIGGCARACGSGNYVGSSIAIGSSAVANRAGSIVINSTGVLHEEVGGCTFNVYTVTCSATLCGCSSWSSFYYNGCALSEEFAIYCNAIAAKATKSTTLSGYGITDAYTKTCVDTLLSAKQNTLTAGDGITISGNTISATGSSVDISGKLDKTCTQIGTDASVISELGGTGVAIGIKSSAGTFAVAIGCMATTCDISRGDIAIGGCASAITCAGSGAGTAHASIAIGSSAYAYGMCNIAIGTKAKSYVEVVDFGFGGAISIGNEASASAQNAIAIGPQSSAIGMSGIAIGCLAKAEKQTIAIGLGAQGCAHSIVLSSCFIEADGAYSCSVKENSFNVFTGGGYTDFYVDGCSLGNELSSMKTAISGKATVSYVDTEVAKKQDKLTAGTNITIENNVISATGGGGDTSALEARVAVLEAALGGYKLVALTQSEYDALTTKDENTLYFIKTA